MILKNKKRLAVMSLSVIVCLAALSVKAEESHKTKSQSTMHHHHSKTHQNHHHGYVSLGKKLCLSADQMKKAEQLRKKYKQNVFPLLHKLVYENHKLARLISTNTNAEEIEKQQKLMGPIRSKLQNSYTKIEQEFLSILTKEQISIYKDLKIINSNLSVYLIHSK